MSASMSPSASMSTSMSPSASMSASMSPSTSASSSMSPSTSASQSMSPSESQSQSQSASPSVSNAGGPSSSQLIAPSSTQQTSPDVSSSVSQGDGTNVGQTSDDTSALFVVPLFLYDIDIFIQGCVGGLFPYFYSEGLPLSFPAKQRWNCDSYTLFRIKCKTPNGWAYNYPGSYPRVLLLPPWRDAGSSQGYPQQYVDGNHLYT